MQETKNRVDVLGVPIDPIKETNLKKKLKDLISRPGLSMIFTVNPEYLMAANEDEEFKKILNSSDLNSADGIGILWASKFLSWPVKNFDIHNRGERIRKKQQQIKIQSLLSLISIILYPSYIKELIPERITGTKIIRSLFEIAAKKNHPIFLLGGKKGIADSAKFELEKEYPEILVTATMSGYLDKNQTNQDWINAINNSNAEILFVALGSPKQEYWIYENKDKLKNVKIAIGIGGAIDFLAKTKTRAPKFLRKHGLEWLYRLYREPCRLPRIKKATIRFIKFVIREKLKNY